MFGCIHQGRTSDRQIFLDLDRQRRGLAALQIVSPDVAGLFENDRFFPDRRKFDVEIFEVGELLCFLRDKIDNKQIHPAVAIGNEIDLVVRSPHRANVLGRIVGQVFSRAGFEIVDPNVVGHSAAIMFPSSELAENAIERHFRIVR